jgi:hypothetical protein
VIRIADEAIGTAECKAIHRPAHRHAEPLQPGTTGILNSGQESGR